MSSSSFHLLEALKSSLLQLWLRVQDHGNFSIAVVFGLIVLYVARYLASPYRKLPPGPRGYPILGNLLEVTAGQWLKFAEWHKKYGDLIYLNAAGQPIVSSTPGKLPLNKPRNILVCDIMTHGLVIGFAPFGETAANEGFSKSSVKGFYETQITEAVLLASDLLVGPARWDQHLHRASASLILSVLYGYPTLRSEQDHILVGVKDFPIVFLRLLLWVLACLAKWKGDAEAWYKKDSAMFEGLFHMVEANVAKGEDHQKRTWFGGTMYVGGAESSSSQMEWWMFAMLAYPETQARAHAELDAVVGRDRSPTLETYRPTGIATSIHWDDWYEGMFIPKGTICIPNVWHMNRDPELFGKNAEHFDPARYLDANGCLHVAPGLSDIKEEGHFTYGFGRRICVGRHMADNSLFINMAIMLWANRIEGKKDASGRLIPLDLDGWLDIGLVMLADFITFATWMLMWAFISADVRSLLRSRLHPASQRQLDACTGT
ncbi:cytochrome P450 [Russula vinacea]|nr:cytochrome P450 [Russula vinacea]